MKKKSKSRIRNLFPGEEPRWKDLTVSLDKQKMEWYFYRKILGQIQFLLNQLLIWHLAKHEESQVF